MHNHKPGITAQACGAQVASQGSTHPQFQQLKLALDLPAASIVVVRMADGAKPQPPQRFKPADFLVWAKQQAALAKKVVSCYEAGPTGFWLHRQLTALGIRNDGVCPTCLDERRAGVNNDRTGALELATRLHRYLAGNDRALAVLRAAGRDDTIPEGHTVGKTFCRRVLLPSSQRQELARSRPPANRTTTPSANPHPRVDSAPALVASNPLPTKRGKGDRPRPRAARFREDLRGGERVRKFLVEGRRADGQWLPLVRGSQVGNRQIFPIPPVALQQLGLRVQESAAPANIREFSVFRVNRPVPKAAHRGAGQPGN